MFILSKLKEADQTLLDIKFTDNSCAYPPRFEKRNVIIQHPAVEGEFFAYYTDGFCITKNQFNIQQKCSNIVSAGSDYIQISMQVSGKSAIYKKAKNHHKEIPLGMFQLAYRNEVNTNVDLLYSKEPFRYIRVFITRNFFLNLLSNEPWAKQDSFYKSVQNHQYVRFGNDVLPLNNVLSEILDEIMNNDYPAHFGQYFIQSKLKELFLTIHVQKTKMNNSHMLPSDEMNKIQMAKAYLGTTYHNPPTIKQLSRKVSLNEFKLKKGFKQVYNTTIRAYITELRMQRARKMIYESYAISEIAMSLGYKSASYFISAYKKIYGETPKQSKH
ncbi:helix-turn-helix transcriptional regulator [Echinicola sp. 20G]|uniref:helix-turn-helix transcriptional regulator n=1 Tax=Echinicola sp. 20G TaxID=2781961 RepID=UPI00191120D8|nr:AraC family transcriptional regulator [Echinicola sp. 20G]